MQPRTRLGLLAASALAAAGTMGVGAVVDAGQPMPLGVDVDITVEGPGAADVLAGLTVEVYDDPAGTQVDPLFCVTTPGGSSEFIADESTACSLAPGDYVIGLDGVPANWRVSGGCIDGLDERLDLGGDEFFTYYGFDSASCSIILSASVLMIDKVVDGGDASASDFVIEVVDSEGDPVVSVSDVSDESCAADFDLLKCGSVAIPGGVGFQISEPTLEDYVLTSVECDQFVNVQQPPIGGADPQPIGEDGFRTDDGDTYCVVTNSFVPPPPPPTMPPTTTTTTTTTVAPTTTTTTTTTLAPTTTAAQTTTTALDAGVATLPQTGPGGDANAWMAITAAMLIAAGGLMLMIRRRPVR